MKYKTSDIRKSPEYRAWINMISRCQNANAPYYKNYGGRGIMVCSEWRNSFEAFLLDMGCRPSSNHSLDRINTNGNYEPSNCRWATDLEQGRNVRRNRKVKLRDREMILSVAIEDTGLKYNTVLYRIRRGWSEEQALSLPLQKRAK